MLTIDALRRFTVTRTFPRPTSLKRALQRIGFVQADPIRAPARAQDLILRQRVNNYHAGDLERLYTKLDIEEDFFINYGYVTTTLQQLMHPRSNARVPADDVSRSWPAEQRRRAKLLFDFVSERGAVHPREVDEYFSHGKVTNYWGGSSNATTHLLDAMHYQGMLRVARRDKGIRLYVTSNHGAGPADAQDRQRRMDALADVILEIYGPLPASSLSFYLRRLRYAVPQWQKEIKAVLERAKARLAYERIDKVDWYWPTGEKIGRNSVPETVRLLAPFDPLVHDRARFEVLWGWTYRFEAYTPAAKRKLGYYAMPLLWRDSIVGWANLTATDGRLQADIGFAGAPIRERAFKLELARELKSMSDFLGLKG
jgi:uncharacterized protein